ncbi:MAG: M1 family metallopeptidase [Cellulophaga sp.]|nr:M1 family metallopeptidase [Cellulophaga sp.]
MPLEFQKAYANGTRSYQGTPGKRYWQNASDYHIDVEIIPGTWKIIGKQTITYTNNSPDSLSEIVIKLYPNHYKKGGVKANEIPLVNLTEGIKIRNLKVNGEVVDLDKNTAVSELAHASKTVNTDHKITVAQKSTFIKLELANPLPPKSSSILTMDWTTEMPSVYVNKIGAYNLESAFIGYWYPQIVVYDDVDGWDETEYTGAQECYTDFGNFKVRIKVPKGYYVYATGDLRNPEQVLSAKEFAAYKQSKTSSKKVSILEDDRSPKKSASIWEFKADKVRDFAFGVSSNFKWIANSTMVADKTISSAIIYDPKEEPYLNNLLEIQNKGIQFLSEDFPGVPFPYHNFTTFMGVPEFDGMEFPMLANNGFSETEIRNNLMTFHEIAHTYLPHWVGINEVKYTWMEEGWVTFFTIKFAQDLYRGTAYENFELDRTMRSYITNTGQQGEPPLFTPSHYMTVRNMHFQQSYRKPAFMYLALEKLLGEALFKTCLQAYIIRWAEKHPTPYDFMFTFNEVSGQNLNWFWTKWIFEYGYTEVGLKKLENDRLTIENIGGLPVPVSLKLTYKKGKTLIIENKPDLWKSSKNESVLKIPKVLDLLSVELISTMFPDVDPSNNILIR